jgi:hypothetical protein
MIEIFTLAIGLALSVYFTLINPIIEGGVAAGGG